jgi:hypothetical protein
MQTLVFNTKTKTAKTYSGIPERSEIMYDIVNVPTVKIEPNYYEVMQKDEEGKTRPVLRLPISNTVMVIVH